MIQPLRLVEEIFEERRQVQCSEKFIDNLDIFVPCPSVNVLRGQMDKRKSRNIFILHCVARVNIIPYFQIEMHAIPQRITGST